MHVHACTTPLAFLTNQLYLANIKYFEVVVMATRYFLRPDSTTAKFFARNIVCEILSTLSAFAVSRTDFYSLAKRNFFSRNLICPYCACVNSFRAKFFAFRREKAVVESSLYRDYLISRRRRSESQSGEVNMSL